MARRSFHKELVLNSWMMGFFEGWTLQALKNGLGEDRNEGMAADGQTGFFQALLQNRLFNSDRISEQDLCRYDLNIAGHWQAITEQRNRTEDTVLHMKYFQYLSLLFTEIYLDWYFNHRQQLLNGLNETLQLYNEEEPTEHRFQPFGADDLNKLAFWNATGSGKTLLLHVNIHQYLHYFQSGHTNSFPHKIILLTPNEGLSHQHLHELKLSGFRRCRLFDKNRSAVLRGEVEIIDINKLGEETGDKTVAVESFEGNNLVLVDEGHRGAGTAAGAWMSRREALVRDGFAFEYSATFGQAVAKGLTVAKAETELVKKKAKSLFHTTDLRKLDSRQLSQTALIPTEKHMARVMAIREIYAKSILFDYSYKFFYEDGYGKDSLILNLKDADYENDDTARQYFTACLLSFYQQQYLWEAHHAQMKHFNIEKPLWVFVGNTVSGEDSDILSVLKFLAGFLNDDVKAKEWLADLLHDTARLLDANGRNIFLNRFTPLMHFTTADQVYADILRKLFNTGVRQRLKVVNLKNCKGELLLRVGESDPFGLINIGDDSGLFKEVEKPENQAWFDTDADAFGGSLFGAINNRESRLNLLLGSRKFTEGWSSWRVSTMGLLNMGKGEGSQIIQLFGRGVRLKGKGFSLKRTTAGQRPRGLHLEHLETLNIFGVNAGYMATFKNYLKEEGITPPDEMIQLDFETAENLPTRHNLKTLALKDGYGDNQIHGFKRALFPKLYEIPDEFAGKLRLPHVTLDLYPRVDALAAGKKPDKTTMPPDFRNSGKISAHTKALFDLDRIYLAIQEYKHRNGWSNLQLDRSRLADFCLNDPDDWYTLLIPFAELEIAGMSDIHKQEDIFIRLLQDYTQRFYLTLKTAYEGRFYDVVTVTANDGLVRAYHFDIENTETGGEFEKKLRTLQGLIKSKKIGEANRWHAGQMVAICFESHLYHPLFASRDGTPVNDGNVPLKMRPLSFDSPGEVRFVRDLEAFYKSPQGRNVIGRRSLYLLRNADTKARGLGLRWQGISTRIFCYGWWMKTAKNNGSALSTPKDCIISA